MTSTRELSNEELLRKSGDLAYAAQMAALESLPLADETKREMAEVADELLRRGVDLHGER
jgi:hypothetical protein